ncbi:hypothetical protein GCM10007972_22440 [Iodidimonas muriae]|uniref:Sel1 repeat family protein n=1 Tax=Iodidimonas muriae TaxID=261467 RepID=A0ABQ2LFM9_9PROT|nr:tetratricopeptide repeat protein [Iodidimonas muriae]GGO14875.1 hypothetical protein GCM10007972_22440 [Iodidimonas muriae]
MKRKLTFLSVLLVWSFQTVGAVAQNLGDGIAAFSLQDYEAARTIFEPLAENGDGDAAFRLGWIYEGGFGVARDPVQAQTWYRRAAQHGHSEAKLRLLELQMADPKAMSVARLEEAAAEGSVKAKIELARLYAAGDGVALDKDRARSLLLSLCQEQISDNIRAYVQVALEAFGDKTHVCVEQ